MDNLEFQNMDCIFCKIATGEAPSYKIYEDDEFMAFLDIFPSHRGQTLVIPKKHSPSRFSSADPETIQRLVVTAQKVAAQIEHNLPGVDRCQMAMEGFFVDHLHIELFPAFKPEPRNHALSHSGERASDDELAALQKLITSN